MSELLLEETTLTEDTHPIFKATYEGVTAYVVCYGPIGDGIWLYADYETGRLPLSLPHWLSDLLFNQEAVRLLGNKREPYSEFVRGLFQPGGAILNRLTAHQLNLMHASMGISGESGELVDAIKKHVMYNKPLDTENVLEEAGDIMFYLVALLNTLGYTLEEAITYNRDKLETRYPNGYSNARAIDRLDKPEEN